MSLEGDLDGSKGVGVSSRHRLLQLLAKSFDLTDPIHRRLCSFLDEFGTRLQGLQIRRRIGCRRLKPQPQEDNGHADVDQSRDDGMNNSKTGQGTIHKE